jgi:hypothetical protein
VSAYEYLRGHALEGGAVAGDPHALGLLVREGIAAWIERRTAGGAAGAPMAADKRPAGAPLAAEDFQASVVRVLASMAMSNGRERRSGQ